LEPSEISWQAARSKFAASRATLTIPWTHYQPKVVSAREDMNETFSLLDDF
jgi:hypothetical protein